MKRRDQRRVPGAIRRGIRRPLTLTMAVGLAALSALAGQSPQASGAPRRIIRIDASKSQPFPAAMRGSNVSHWARAKSLENEALRTRTKGMFPLLRFPGGEDSQKMGWASCQYVAQVENAEPCTTFYGTARPSDFIAFAKAVGAEGVITVNAQATALENAAYVAFMNGSPTDTRPLGIDHRGADWKTVGFWAQLRVDAGQPEPLKVQLWEFGNETYGGKGGAGSRCVSHGWEPVYSCDPKEYLFGAGTGKNKIDGYVETRKAMQFVDPTILLGAPIVDPKAGYNGWTEDLFALGGKLIDFVDIHHYMYWIPPKVGGSANSKMLADPRVEWPRLYARVTSAMDKYAGKRLPVLVSEYNLLPDPSNDPAQRIVTLLNGFMMTEAVGLFPTLPGVFGANQFDLVGTPSYGDSHFSLMRLDKGFARTPTYWGSVLWSRFGDKNVSVTSTFNPASTLSAFAGRRSDGDITLLVLNKSGSAQGSAISLARTGPINTVAVDTAVASGLFARSMTFNGVANPADDLSDAPSAIYNADGANEITWTFPAYSMTLLRFDPQ